MTNTPVHEIPLAFQWLFTTLSTDATLTSLAPGGVWRSLAPVDTIMPFVVLSFLSGSDVTTIQGVRVITEVLMQVRVVGMAKQTAQVAQAAAQLDSLLRRTAGTVTGGAVLACYRQSPLQLDELVAGQLVVNIGGLYRILLQQVPF